MALIDVEVSLDEFPDDEILEAAVEIVQRAMKAARENPGRVDKQIVALRVALAGSGDDDDLPLSTAARLSSMSDLRRWVEKESRGLFHFAEAVAIGRAPALPAVGEGE